MTSPSGLWIAMSVRYFGVMVATMWTPTNSIARMQRAMIQCSPRWSGVKRTAGVIGSLLSRFADSPSPRPVRRSKETR